MVSFLLRIRPILVVVSIVVLTQGVSLAQVSLGYPPAPISDNFQLVGHNPLLSRGMNSAPAIYGNHAYIGSRTDASDNHLSPTVLVVDIEDPSDPQIVGEIGPPDQGNNGETSRELRVWTSQGLLMVLNFPCSSSIHACSGFQIEHTIKFYDVRGVNEADPQLISMYHPSFMPHEFFLWEDPQDPSRALIYFSTPTSSLTNPNIIVTDISRAREGVFTELATWNGNSQFSSTFRSSNDVRVHSIGVTDDGNRTHVAYLGGGYVALDSSDFAAGLPTPELRVVSPIGTHPSWGDPGAHSAVQLPGRPYVLITDEVYGASQGADHGCPWGWVRMIDISNETTPTVVGEFRSQQNADSYCMTLGGLDPRNTDTTSYSAHNPTVLPNLAFITWHSAGLYAIRLDNPAAPVRAGQFIPEPLAQVTTEDPALGAGLSKVIMWSYPIIYRGLIYVVDVRNGLYILRYTGPGADEVAGVDFLEGNSNLPHAQADVSVTKVDSRDPSPTGRNLTYTVGVANGGPDAAQDVVVTDTLPSGVDFVSATPSQGTCEHAAGIVTCSLGILTDVVASIDIVVIPREAGFIQNTATVTSSTGDPVGFNNQASEETRVCRVTSRRTSIPCG
jgi:uncharacterized repeat protein (TIGR01451 family)